MDILFNSVIGIKEGVFILAIQHLNAKGEIATWKKLSKLMGMSIATVKRISERLEQSGLVSLETKLDELGGMTPTTIILNEELLEKVLKATNND